MRRQVKRSSRGVTLLEAMIAGLVFTIGLTGLFGMIGGVAGANRHLAFKGNSLDVYARIAAEIRDAQCDYPANTPSATNGVNVVMDSALTGALAAGTWPVAVNTITANSKIVTVGAIPNSHPPLFVDYRAFDTTQPGNRIPTMLVEVRIREITNDPVKDNVNLVDGMWIRVFPVEKVCSARLLPTTSFATNAELRGEYQ